MSLFKDSLFVCFPGWHRAERNVLPADGSRHPCRSMLRFLEVCVLPRAAFSIADSLFCAKLIKLFVKKKVSFLGYHCFPCLTHWFAEHFCTRFYLFANTRFCLLRL